MPHLPAHMEFTPVIFECYGAIGASGLTLLSSLAVAWAKRTLSDPAKAIPLVMTRISCCLQHGIAHSLLRNDATSVDHGSNLPTSNAELVAEEL
jgi:hypothetical protein